MIHMEDITIHIGISPVHWGLGAVQLTRELINKIHLFYILKPLMH